MPIRMAALNLSATGATKSRKAIPKDVRAEYKRLYATIYDALASLTKMVVRLTKRVGATA